MSDVPIPITPGPRVLPGEFPRGCTRWVSSRVARTVHTAREVLGRPVFPPLEETGRPGAYFRVEMAAPACASPARWIRVAGGRALLDRAHRGRFGTRPRVPRKDRLTPLGRHNQCRAFSVARKRQRRV